MGTKDEIERKFLIAPDSLPPLGEGARVSQSYLGFEPVVRVRVMDGKGFLTFKSKGLLSRKELEIEIDAKRAEELMEFRVPGTLVIEKTRHKVKVGNHVWEVDFFGGPLAGLAVAEIELASEGEDFVKPDWLAGEVTFDPRYQNANLAKKGSL